MILLLGGSGYIGSAFTKEFNASGLDYRSVSRSEVDYTNRDKLIELIRGSKASFLINAAGCTGKPNVDACEKHKAECLAGNAVLPAVIREACEMEELPWGHVSSGCIYTGTREDGGGFTEEDPPNFCFRTNNCSFYSGCKALGEECLQDAENVYIWRLRVPFNEIDSPRNYLTKLLTYNRLLDATNSLSHLGEVVRCCKECWTKRVPFGIYNVTNTGCVTTREVVSMIRQYVCPSRSFDFFEDEQEFLRVAAKTPRSNCVLDNTKLIQAGIRIAPVRDAILESLQNWHPSDAEGTADEPIRSARVVP